MSIDFPKEEEAVLQRWREIDAFLRQVRFLITLCRLYRMIPLT